MVGTSGDDFLRIQLQVFQDLPIGTHISTFAGADNVEGSGVQSLMYDLGTGNDIFNGDAGIIIDDIVDGGLGNDTLQGDNGNDILTGGEGDDIIRGENGDDMLIIGVGHNNVADNYRGGAGTDTLVNNSGTDFLFTYYDAAGFGTANGFNIEFIDLNGHQMVGT